MVQHWGAVWLAGLLMGTGLGLIIGRSLPPQAASSSRETAAKSDAVHLGASTVMPEESQNLFDPRSPAPLRGGELDVQRMSVPDEPRRFPEGAASPVTEQAGRVSAMRPAGAEMPAGGQTGFRAELQELAPEFSADALDELTRIRAIIETDEARIPLDRPAKPDAPPLEAAPATAESPAPENTPPE